MRRLWDLATGACKRVLEGHTGRLNAVCVGPGGTTALTVSDDYTGRVWDLASGTCLHVLKGARRTPCRPVRGILPAQCSDI